MEGGVLKGIDTSKGNSNHNPRLSPAYRRQAYLRASPSNYIYTAPRHVTTQHTTAHNSTTLQPST